MYTFVLERDFQEFKGEEVILFGAGSSGEKCLEEFELLGAKILGFCDNNRARRGEMLKGYPIFSPEDLQDKKEINIMITSTFDDEIRTQLKQLGMKKIYTVRIGVLHEKINIEQFHNKFYSKEEINQKIYNLICSKNPFFAGRLGSTELECISEYFYLLDRVHGSNKKYGNNIKMIMKEWTGFYPTEEVYMDQFCKLYQECLQKIDILSTMWTSKFEDKLFTDFCSQTKIALYDDMAFPIDMELPWTNALKGKKVLVIHPFEKSIQENYKKRELLFQNSKFLPEFELLTMQAVQSVGLEQPEYATWFLALDSMKEKMKQIDFDVALIGAGGYGLPLAAYAKELGKQGILIGGMLQLYFGIKGKVWDTKGYYNEYWTRPLEEEKPQGYQRVEAGRYW